MSGRPHSALYVILLAVASLVFCETLNAQTQQFSDEELSAILEEEFGRLDAAMEGQDPLQIAQWFGLGPGVGEWIQPDSGASVINSIYLADIHQSPPGALAAINKAAGPYLGAGGEIQVAYELGLGVGVAAGEHSQTVSRIGQRFGLAQTVPAVRGVFDWAGKAGFALTVATAVADFDKAGTTTGLKLATGTLNLIYGANPAIGCTLWLVEWCIGKAEQSMAKASTEIIWNRYAIHFTGVHWSQVVRNGSLESVLKQLNDYWKYPELDSIEEHRQWVVANIPNYREVYAARMMREIIGPQLVSYFKSEAQWAKEKAVEQLRDYLRSIPQRRAKIFWKISYEDLSGKRLDINPPLEVEVWFGDSQMDEDLYDLDHTSERLEVEMNLADYLRGVSASEGVIGLKVFAQVAGERERLFASPSTVYLALGEDETDGPVHIQLDGSTTTVVPEKPMRIRVWTLPVRVRVITPDGSVATGSIRGPGGAEAEIDKQGFATIAMPSSGESWVSYTQPGYASGGDPATIFDGSNGDLTKVQQITIQVPAPDTVPPMPPEPTCEYLDLVSKIDRSITEYRHADIDFADFDEELQRTLKAIEVIRDNAVTGMGQYERAIRARIAQQQMTPADGRAQIERVGDRLNEQTRGAYLVLDDIRTRANAAMSEWSEECSDAVTDLRTMAREANEHAAVIWKAAKVATQAEQAAVQMGTPRTFRTLAEVQVDRDRMTWWVDRVEGHRSEADLHLGQLVPALRAAGLHLTRFEESTAMTAGHWPTHSDTMRKLINGERARQLGHDIIDACDLAEEVVRGNDGILSWVQLGALRAIERAEAFDKLNDNPPGVITDGSRAYALLAQISELLGNAAAQRIWSSSLGRRNNEQTHEGYGMAAYPFFAEAEALLASSSTTIDQALAEGEQWAEQIKAARQQLVDDIQAMRNSGWAIDEVINSLNMRTSGARRESLVQRLASQRDDIRRGIEQQRPRFNSTAARAGTDWPTLLADHKQYRRLLERGLAAAKADNLERAEQIIDELAPLKVSRQQRVDRELLLDRETYDLENTFFTALWQLRQKMADARLATLTIDLKGQDIPPLDMDIVDANGNDWALYPGDTDTRFVARLEPGRYTVTAAAMGVRIDPARTTIELGEGASENLVIHVAPATTTGSGSASHTAGSGDYDPDNVRRRVVAVNAHMPDDAPPVWTADGRTVIVSVNRDPFGLMAFNLVDGTSRRLLTEKPVIPHHDDSTTICHQPILARNALICRMNMSYRDPGGNSSYYYWISVPLDGGPAVPLFASGAESLIGLLPNSYLMLGKLDDKRTIYKLPFDSPDDANALQYRAIPKPAGERVVIDPSRTVIATADWRQPWRIYTRGGQLITTLPESIGRWLSLSPDGKWAAGEYFDGDKTSGIAIIPITADAMPRVVDTKGVTFGYPGWSPDGRYLAYRAFQGNDREELIVLDLKPDGHSLAEAGEQSAEPQAERSEAMSTESSSGNSAASYDAYIEAYNALTTLMSQGKGDTPEAQAAYKAYQEAKRRYEEAFAAENGN